MIELKPCPFCGGTAGIDDEYEYKAYCSSDDCYCSLNKKSIRDGYDGYFDKEDAISEWNNRPMASAAKAEIAEYRELLGQIVDMSAMSPYQLSIVEELLEKHNLSDEK